MPHLFLSRFIPPRFPPSPLWHASMRPTPSIKVPALGGRSSAKVLYQGLRGRRGYATQALPSTSSQPSTSDTRPKTTTTLPPRLVARNLLKSSSALLNKALDFSGCELWNKRINHAMEDLQTPRKPVVAGKLPLI